jgi:hypothetical protein
MNRKHQKLTDLPKDSIIDFVNLYVNYRLKVQDAIARGFDKDSAVVEDIEPKPEVACRIFLLRKETNRTYS